MRLSEGVEWGLHCCLAIAWADDGNPVSTSKLATLYGLPKPYLAKHLRALVDGDVLVAVPGARGGFRLSRPAREITFMDVVSAIDGRTDAFRCTEVRAQGVAAAAPDAPELRRPCGIATVMRKAELAWRRELAARTLADLIATTPKVTADRTRRAYQRLST
ncbi:RrF2 family transcriptional regulator [Actinokineospora enzanensis]|uniref:RrF2 family transcriptional regulator n=1 Tax=Actinokineospora enzanensis TaxID=155975 RepID=UPI000368C545|nr:Rrf2 family transcriptional regulator [Actinokineospora enzanensis]